MKFQAIHDGINCKQYQDQLNNDANSESAKQTKLLLQELIDKEEALNCPTCQIFLLKKWGCDWLKCSFCKTEICWVTRGKHTLSEPEQCITERSISQVRDGAQTAKVILPQAVNAVLLGKSARQSAIIAIDATVHGILRLISSLEASKAF